MASSNDETGRRADAGPRRTSRLRRAATGRFGLLLVALVALMAATPLIISGPVHNALLSLFTGAVLVASLHAARSGGTAVFVGLGLALVDVAIGRCVVAFGGPGLILLQVTFWLATLLYVIATLLEAIFESERVTLETLQASLCVYLLIGVLGAFGLTFLQVVLPGSFEPAHGPAVVWADEASRATEFLRLFVLSFATLSGSSYGEVGAATGFAANALSLEAMAGQIYLAVVIARLVGLHATPTPPGPAAPESDG